MHVDGVNAVTLIVHEHGAAFTGCQMIILQRFHGLLLFRRRSKRRCHILDDLPPTLPMGAGYPSDLVSVPIRAASVDGRDVIDGSSACSDVFPMDSSLFPGTGQALEKVTTITT
jgi:hypothetical protein